MNARKSEYTKSVCNVEKAWVMLYLPQIFIVGVFRNASSLTTGPKLVFGLFIVIIIATSWVLSTQLAKSTYTGNFKAPFFLVWFGTSWMILLYPVTIPFYFVLVCKLPTWSAFKELWK